MYVRLKGAATRPAKLGLDLHEHAGRDDQAVQGIDGAGGVVVDVDHPLVGAHLELLARLLVDVGAAEDRVPLDPRRDRDRPADACVGPLGVLDDLLRRRVQRPVVVRLHPNSNPLALHSPCSRLLGNPPLLSRTATDKSLFAVHGRAKHFSVCSRRVNVAGGKILDRPMRRGGVTDSLTLSADIERVPMLP